MTRRLIFEKQITKNIFLCVKDQRIALKENSLRLREEIEVKPLVVIFSWLQAERKHLLKFAEFYHKLNFDACVVQLTPWQLLFPTKGSQIVALDLVNFLAYNDSYKPILLHGFSVGGYLWSECLVQIHKKFSKYHSIVDRIAGQIWDSTPDLPELADGLQLALFPNNPWLRTMMKNYVHFHMKTFEEEATQHYIRASKFAHGKNVKVPALFFVSKNDMIGSASSNQKVAEEWKSRGVQVTFKCFENSPHVGHFLAHREEYLKTLSDHLRSINLLSNEKNLFNAKL